MTDAPTRSNPPKPNRIVCTGRSRQILLSSLLPTVRSSSMPSRASVSLLRATCAVFRKDSSLFQANQHPTTRDRDSSTMDDTTSPLSITVRDLLLSKASCVWNANTPVVRPMSRLLTKLNCSIVLRCHLTKDFSSLLDIPESSPFGDSEREFTESPQCQFP